MPTRKPHQQRKRRPRVAARGRRPGAYVDAVRPETSASAYAWPCPRCDGTRNLRGLLRDVCAHCQHVHQPPAEKESV